MTAKPFHDLTPLERSAHRMRAAISWSMCDSRDDSFWKGRHGKGIEAEYRRMSSILGEPLDDDDSDRLWEEVATGARA